MSTLNARLAALILFGALAWAMLTPQTSSGQQITEAAAALYNEATQAISGGQYADAIAKLDKVIALEPGFARAYFDRGFSQEQLQDFAAAAADYGKACEIEPDNADACFGQGKALYYGQQYTEALPILTAVAEGSDKASFWIQRARCEDKLKMYEEASASAVKATELEPENADGYYELGAIEYDRQAKTKQYDAAIAAYTKALELGPDHGNAFAAHFKLGKMYYRTKQYADAEAHFAGALEVRPDYAPAYIDLGNARKSQENFDGAIEAYNQAIEMKAPEPYGMAYYSLGRLYWSQDDAEAAISAYEMSTTDPSFKHAAKAREAIASIEEYLTKKKKQGGVY